MWDTHRKLHREPDTFFPSPGVHGIGDMHSADIDTSHALRHAVTDVSTCMQPSMTHHGQSKMRMIAVDCMIAADCSAFR